ITEINLKENLKENLPIGLLKIAHLLAILNILKEQKSVQPNSELSQLKTQDIAVQMEAGMPGPSLAYLGALKQSSISSSAKIVAIDKIISSLSKNKNKFGQLDNIVLIAAVNDWIAVVDKKLENEPNQKIRTSLSDRKDKYIKLLSNYPAIEETKEKLDLVEKYILLSCELLKNDIGKIDSIETVNIPENSNIGVYSNRNSPVLWNESLSRANEPTIYGEVKDCEIQGVLSTIIVG
ncbi:MAG: hypothetical protein K2Z81_21290, partial [Cyanobacteria bacterium]|nr:hypothetical protein [Cyanobacteriota bacterium]